MTEEDIEERIRYEDEKEEETERDYDFKRTKNIDVTELEWVKQNTNKAIWLREKEELT
jgi:hypothetical protein